MALVEAAHTGAADATYGPAYTGRTNDMTLVEVWDMHKQDVEGLAWPHSQVVEVGSDCYCCCRACYSC
jgi:hypothetical protein